MSLQRVAVYCGSSIGARSEYMTAARQLGALMAKRHIELVYGGARVGLMGAIAQAVLDDGGHVIGVIPKSLAEVEVVHHGLSELHIVESMHERKSAMVQLADGFIALPGGFGTLEEFFEVLAWAQLKIHQKPCGLLNTNQYYDGLLQFVKHTLDEAFIQDQHLEMILVDSQPEALIDKMNDYVTPHFSKKEWILRQNNLR